MITELCIDVINSFRELNSSLGLVTHAICEIDKDLPGWFQEPPALDLAPSLSNREKACALLRQLEYLDSQKPREILVGAGLFAASQTTIDALAALNTAKNNFKRAILKLKAAKISTSDEFLTNSFESLLSVRNKELATTLTRMGMARVHLKQCYRRVPYFLVRPSKVSWTWANTRSIKKINKEDALLMLQKGGQDQGIMRQIQLLQGIPSTEKLAIVQELAPHLRANLVFPGSDGNTRLMVKGPVPLFYLHEDNLVLPDFVPPGAKKGKDKERTVRKDVKINPEPFLPAIRAHRYFSTSE